ncbi:RNA polymerase factor sigma-32 [Moraxella lacunata]|uniref:RNA polymerase sigma factor RpoH n=2 Tax=Moraxella lacunata TaxID=477 RepID=A0A1B8PVX5_MORLA|nr:RNA polymerase factor sigma-32 [Moraxella lacunata]OBX61724.1 RNA polymerase factor sigma-32 [Moraxella lacunata]
MDNGLDELDGFSDEILSDELLSDELDELDGFHEIDDDADELALDESEHELETDGQSHDRASLAPVLASHAPSAVPRYDVATKDLVPAMPTNLTAPGVNLGAYINTVHQIPILTPDEERELAERYYQDGDVEAARLLVMSHLRFVIHIARSYSGYGLSQADLIQEGNLGLMKAVKRFDPTKGVRLVSFAVHWIKAEIHEFVIKNWRIVKVATTKAHRKLFFNLRSLKKSSNQLTLEEAEAIAKDLNVTVKQVLEMESRLTSYDASFELQESDDEDGRYAPQLFLEDGVNPAEMVEDADWEENTTTALKEAMDGLDERSRDIITQRWLADQKSTLHDLAAVYNISAERVRQIEKNAMDKIREAMTIDNMLFD